MAAINQVGNALTGLTGAGAFVGANTPTLITPVLGVASATSINFGGGALGNYVPRTSWTPVFTFATPGDLALSGVSTKGFYVRVGDLVTLFCDYSFTVTYTTASGNATLTGLPIASVAGQGGVVTAISLSNSVIYPVGSTYLVLSLSGSSTTLIFVALGSGAVGGALTTAHIASGSSNTLRFITQYFVA